MMELGGHSKKRYSCLFKRLCHWELPSFEYHQRKWTGLTSTIRQRAAKYMHTSHI